MAWFRRKAASGDKAIATPKRDGLYLESLCNCETYNLYRNGEKIAYFRLKFGRFTVEAPGSGGKFEYVVTFEDMSMNRFPAGERDYYLAAGVRSVIFDRESISLVRDLNLTYDC